VRYGPARARYERRKRRRQMMQSYAGLWNFLTILIGIGTLIAAGWFIWKMFLHPVSANAEPIPTSTIEVQVVNPRVTPVIQPPANVGNPIKATPTIIIPTAEDTSSYTFDLQARPESISARLFNQERTCNWMGIAGQAFDMQGRPIPGITVQVSGPMYGKDIQFLSMTGSANWYGEGGYEIFLSDKPMDTMGEFEIRLVDQLGRGLSPKFKFNTSSDCEKNLVVMNFKQIK
jgi:hypothetical protein